MQVLRAASDDAVPEGEPTQCREHVRCAQHHYTDVSEDLSVVVVFAPAERSRT